MSLTGKVSLVTGASRGIGAETTLRLAALGSDVVINYRNKRARADEVVARVQELGRRAIALQADLTEADQVDHMLQVINDKFGQLGVLVLNASGGLERDKAEGYAMALNRDAQLRLAKLSTKLMHGAGRIVFVTSHWAHFYGHQEAIPGYEPVARSKYEGEKLLREYAAEIEHSGISLIIVSGDVIEGTITPRLLERSKPGLMEARRNDVGALPTVAEFAQVIARAASDQNIPSGKTIFVGPNALSDSNR